MALKLVSFSKLKTNMTASTQEVNCNSGGPPFDFRAELVIGFHEKLFSNIFERG